ncbi:MAG: two-component sensor histidine kinase, partial [Muriicola sp.]|nr:two-component sensor histidine kinase [Muriicola sp.]
MSLSLVGIISVQLYWIKSSVEDKEEQFSNTVAAVLNRVTDKIEDREMRDYSDRLLNLKDSVGELKSSHYSNIFFIDRDLNSNEILFYSHGILEEDYNIASTFFDSGTGSDSTAIKNFTSKRTKTIFKEEYGLDGKGFKLNPIQKLEKIGGLSSVDKAVFDDVYRELAEQVPLHKRVTKQEIELLLDQELQNRSLDIDFEYGIYSRGLPTKIKSRRFKFGETTLYKSPIFRNSEGSSNFSLMLSFPKKKKFLLKSILGMAFLSLLFTLVIVIAYSSAIYQLIRQK